MKRKWQQQQQQQKLRIKKDTTNSILVSIRLSLSFFNAYMNKCLFEAKWEDKHVIRMTFEIGLSILWNWLKEERETIKMNISFYFVFRLINFQLNANKLKFNKLLWFHFILLGFFFRHVYKRYSINELL